MPRRTKEPHETFSGLKADSFAEGKKSTISRREVLVK